MNTFGRFSVGVLALFAFETIALSADARFLSFAGELQRARAAIGPDADRRVFIEDILARRALPTAGTHAIQIQFADVSGNMLPRKSVVVTRGTIEPQRLSRGLAGYGQSGREH